MGRFKTNEERVNKIMIKKARRKNEKIITRAGLKVDLPKQSEVNESLPVEIK